MGEPMHGSSRLPNSMPNSKIKTWPNAALLAILIATLLAGATGCETCTTHKTRLHADMSDVTTTPPATAHADPAGVQAEGQPPVPGSPTASNADGTQPPDDSQARNSSTRSEARAGGGKP